MTRRKPATAVIRGNRWRLCCRESLPEGQLGECNYVERKVYIPLDTSCESVHDLDTTVHELLHAATELDEVAVSETATAIARVLWRLGWRREEP